MRNHRGKEEGLILEDSRTGIHSEHPRETIASISVRVYYRRPYDATQPRTPS